MSDTSESFNENYKILKDTADWLTQQQEPDIDSLVPKVESAMQAYKVCKTRLEAVQATLAQYLEPDGEARQGDPLAAENTGTPARK